MCMRPDYPLFHDKALSVQTVPVEDFTEAEEQTHLKYQYSLYHTLTEHAHRSDIFATSVSHSNNIALHKKLISEGLAFTYMPKLAYETEFRQDGYACLPMQGPCPIYHWLIYKNQPNSKSTLLTQTFLQFVQKKFQRQFGIYEKKKP